jgi:amidase
MIIKEYSRYDGLGLAELVRRREVSPEDLVDSAIDAIERLNPRINCVVQVLRDHAMAEAKAAPRDAPFCGAPLLIKEFGMHFKGMRSSGGSRLGQGITWDADTHLMSRFRQAGFVTVGTSTTPEMAFNTASEALAYGPTRNPWNLNHSVGGSSGGAGAAVASGMVAIAHANDGGGSIRIPAACNGVVGMKVSRGRTPTGPDVGIFLWGLAVEFAETRTVRDSAALLDALGAPEEGAFYGAPPPRGSYLAAAMTPPKALRIGVVDSLPGGARITGEIAQRLDDTRRLLEDLGHVCEPVRIAYDAETFNSSTLKLWGVTLAFYMNLFAEMTGRAIGPDTVEAVTLEIYREAKTITGLDLELAMAQQNAITRQACAAMRGYDVILTPGLARDIAPIGELNQNAPNVDMAGWWDQIVQGYSPFTPLFNTTGQPAIMLPLWQAASGLPLAMQFAAPMGDEETLYSLAGQLEAALPWSGRRPPNYA